MGINAALYSGVSGLNANGNALSVIGNNIANNNTIGFKSGKASFSDLLSSTIASSGGGSQIGRGVGMASVDNIFTQGTFENTSRDTDLAVEGKGFFIVRDPADNSQFYTRAGSFRWDADGYLTTPEGYRVMGYGLNDQENISGDLTEIKVDTTTLSPPEATTEITFTTNLDAASPYMDAVVGSFTATESTRGGDASALTDPATAPLTVNGRVLGVPGGGTYNQGSAKVIKDALDAENGIGAEAVIQYADVPLDAVSQVMTAGNWTLGAGDLVINGVDMDGIVAGNDDQAIYNQNVVDHFNAKLNATGISASIDPDTFVLTLASTDGSNIQIESSVDHSGNVLGLNGNRHETTFSQVEIRAYGTDTGKLTVDVGTDDTYGLVINGGQTRGRDAGFDITDPENTSNYANSVTMYDSLGNPHQGTVYFTKKNPAQDPLEWEYHFTVDGAELAKVDANGDQLTGPYLVATGTLEFTEDGTLKPGTASGLTTGAGDLPWNNNSDPAIQLDIDFNTTQWSNASLVISQDQNGFGTGSVAQLSIDNEGNIQGNFSNGVPKGLFRLALASFANINGLDKVGNNMFTNSGDSGSPIVGTVGSGIGKIFTNSLEQSNVDLAAEFVSMITTQRGFQANSKVITTTDEMLGELINLKR